MPTVSVIIPTHNRANYLPLAISSVLNQSFHDFEILIVDDGSTDSTAAVVAGFRDQRIQVYPSRKEPGRVGSQKHWDTEFKLPVHRVPGR